MSDESMFTGFDDADDGLDVAEQRGDRRYEARNERESRFIRQGGRSATNPWDARAWLDLHPERDFDEDGNAVERKRDERRGGPDDSKGEGNRASGGDYRNARGRGSQVTGGGSAERTYRSGSERGGWRQNVRDRDGADGRDDREDRRRDDREYRDRSDRQSFGGRDRDRDERAYDRYEREERYWDKDEDPDDYYDEDEDDYDADYDYDESRFDDPYARRVENPCPVAKRCGGCEWLSMPYDEQLARKQEQVEELFGEYKCGVDGIMGMNYPYRYRNKVQLPFAPGWPNREGRMVPRWGIFERGSHYIVPCDDCVIEDERARPIIADVADLMPRYNIKPYDERYGDGWLRYCLVRTALTTGEVMVTLVATAKRIPSEKAFVSTLLDRHPEIATIVVNLNKERTSVILGEEERVVYGPGYIVDELCGCKFRISSSSFYQTNPIAAEALYDIAVELADLGPDDTVGDAYCGTGTIGIVAAKKSGASLIGIERNPDAVADARENAALNGVENAEFIVGDAGSVFARMARAGESLDVVFMDPPRAGANQAFLANLCRLSPTRVVYISCEPKTQRRDITTLLRNGYQIRRICPVDMFPHTDHVENIVLLERKQVSQGRGGAGKKVRDHSWLNADQTTSVERGAEADEHGKPDDDLAADLEHDFDAEFDVDREPAAGRDAFGDRPEWGGSWDENEI